jgi:hypothetical protein
MAPIDGINTSTSNFGIGNDLPYRTETVQLGENRLSDVAERTGYELSSLLKANPQIKNPDDLTPGQEIKLPHEMPVPLRDDVGNDRKAANASDLPKAPVGDPLAASAMKASLLSSPAQADKPQDYVTDYPIVPGNENKLEIKDDVSVHTFPTISVEHHIDGYREANAAGLQERLGELNGGRPLTDFEKGLVANWGKDSSVTIVPIMKVGEEGVQGYAITAGGSGDRVTTTYDRQGNQIGQPRHYEAGLVSEGLGPIDYFLGARAAKGIVGGLIGRVRAGLAGEAAEVAGKKLAQEEGEAVASGAGAKAAKQAYDEGDELIIKSYMQKGMSRAEAEKALAEVKDEFRGQRIEHVKSGPNGTGTTRQPDWKIPGPGKKRP